MKKREQEQKDKPNEEDPIKQRIEELVIKYSGYGYRKVTEQLKKEGWVVNHKKVERIMKENGWQCRPRRRRIITTDPDPNSLVYKNKIKELKITNINRVWVADLTSIRIQGGFGYLALIVDICSRKIVGWALAHHKEDELTKTALRMALKRRNPKAGWIHHSDQGAQYAAGEYVHLVKSHRGTMSMAAKGNPYENAIAERCIRTIKWEEANLSEYRSLGEAYERLEYFIETVYNKERLHASLGYKTPTEFEGTLA